MRCRNSDLFPDICKYQEVNSVHMEILLYTINYFQVLHNIFVLLQENNTAQANVNNIRKQLEKKVLEKQDLEKKISEELRDRLTAQKAANYANKININVQDQSRELLTQASDFLFPKNHKISFFLTCICGDEKVHTLSK